jgi:tRNA1(Val) A37 N6-methylase TrmN6
MHSAPFLYSDDWFLDGRLLLRQPVKGHRIGTDALLLAAITPHSGRVCDLGSGVGAIGLALALRGNTRAVLVERNPVFSGYARHNVLIAQTKNKGAVNQAEMRGEMRGEMRADVIEADVFDRRAFLQEPLLCDQGFDAVATNPPFDQVLRGRKSPSELKTAAHAMDGGSLADWLKVAVRLLKDGGVLTLIHRADRLGDVLSAMPVRAGGLVVRPVLPLADQAATRILVQATAGSRRPLTLLAPLVLHHADGRFTADAEALHKGRARMLMHPGPLVEEI